VRTNPVGQGHPPQAFAVGFSEFAVVGDAGVLAGLVGTLGDFIPAPCVRGVDADTEAQAVVVCGFGPAGDEVFFGSDVDGVPGLIFAVVINRNCHDGWPVRQNTVPRRVYTGPSVFRGPSFRLSIHG